MNAPDGHAPEKLAAILRAALERSHQNKGLIRLLAESDQESHVRRKVRPRVLQTLTRVFEQGMQEDSFRPHNAAHTGRMFHGCLSGLFELQAEGASNEEVNDYVEVLIDAVHNGFSIHVEKSREPGKGAPRSPDL